MTLRERPRTLVQVSGDAPSSDASTGSRLSRALLVRAAGVVAEQLRADCVEAGRDAGWATEAQGDAGADVYGGPPGIALFLAAYARVTGCDWARDLCLRAIAPTRRAVPAERPASGIGGLVGRGAQIYALATLARLLDEPALLTEAHELAVSVEPAWIDADRAFDVVHGSAGLILALLRLESVAAEPGPGERVPLDHVRAASAHLLAHQLRGPPWVGAVISQDHALPQSGFAHGATGVSVALARAGQALEDDALLRAAAGALAFERAHCLAAPGRWRVAPEDARTPIGWCRGAPGAALGRRMVLAAMRGRARDAEITEAEAEIGQSLAFMQQHPRLSIDHLCCGGMGVAETLLALHQAGGPAWLLDAAHARASWMLRAAKTRGGFCLGTGTGTEPSLFQGLAGVGYGLLRLAEPAALPCVLMLA